MSAKVINGKLIAAKIRKNLVERIESLRKNNVIPGLTVVQVGDNLASTVYVSRKEKTAKELGLNSETIHLPNSVSQQELLNIVDGLNNNPSIHGILVQMPLPGQIDPNLVIRRISPEKDVDGFHPENVGLLVLGTPRFIPCTPAGIMEMLSMEKIDPAGKNVVVLGRSNIVGKPMANLLLQKADGANATVTICHTKTKNLKQHTKNADILIVALGRAHAIDGGFLKQGAVVIDVGVNRIEDSSRKSGYRLVGDVEFESAKEFAAAISPVPGGVGPMTIIMLMVNTVMAAELI
ncbi:bifunctional 5,10-methylene-tetrahydrofolate dehydrogenase/5,10-methylene-tetrahydrofolate cyclohydrolase [candidate division KSB1 bacterium]|nr:bifunctional 5,10-methylene-tetrahydrofolate dehydrogenase/5,10-methylene-tetrahydrofolate cyclohydrolase [candidate division KSB1 bacterium]